MGLKIAVAMSGGVDSTAAALMLKAQGHQLVGVFMRNWDEVNEQGQCSSEEDFVSVQQVCSKIDIPCKRVELIKEYWNDVFSHFLDGLRKGFTPNPDVICNQRIKFNALFHHLSSLLDVEKVATGHYARIKKMEDGSVKLLQGVDRLKDQSYFLSLVSQSSLQRTLFPVGHMTKQDVRQLVCDSGFKNVAERKESYGLCFVGKRKFSRFISNYLEERAGDIVSTDGEVLGHHKGHYFYTLGQRAGLGGLSSPHYVVSKCPERNTVTVAPGATHPALYTRYFLATPPHWIHQSHDLKSQSKQCQVRTNHGREKKMVPAKLSLADSTGVISVSTSLPLRAVAAGQYAVFYDGEECLGASRILHSNSDLKDKSNGQYGSETLNEAMNKTD